MSNKSSHWNHIAQRWHLVGPPLRPSREDILHFEQAVDRKMKSHAGPLRALILGVTPELAALNWPPGTRLSALDGSAQMVDALWKGPREGAMVGSWTNAPIKDASLDMIVCDGGVGVLSYPADQQKLLTEIRRMLAPNGMFTVRLFVPGCHAEPIEQIAADLEARAIPSLDALKFRLWGALQANVASGVRPRDVVRHIEKIAGRLARLADCFGWPAEHIATLELHRESQVSYCLSSVADLLPLINAVNGLEMVDVAFPAHPFGDRCPVVSLRRIDDGA